MKTAPCGSWKSPISAQTLVAQAVGLGSVRLAGGEICWIESRPHEGGRCALMRRSAAGQVRECAPTLNARTRVHEYGGGAYAVDGEVAYSANFADQRLYRIAPGAAPQPLTPEGPWRYADGVVDPRRRRLYCVREDHRGPGEAVNTLVAVDLRRGESRVLVRGNDFYSFPRLSPDGSRLAWTTWNHPNMPWDGCELWVGELAGDGSIAGAERVAGGPEESIFQPEWSPDGVLHFVSDRSGWWNLYRWREGQAEALWPLEAEFGKPQWGFAPSTYAFASAGELVCACVREGSARLARLDLRRGEATPVETPYTEINELRAGPGFAVFIGGAPAEPRSLVRLDLESGKMEVLRRSRSLDLDPGYLSLPQAVEFPTGGGLKAHGFFYPPANRDFTAPPGEKPPLLVMSHGGPTGATSTAFDGEIQFWTSRGIGVLDVNYGGSTGYGRAYRQRLEGQWGVVDVEDCARGARYLVEQGLADGSRLAITGGSAGGYTTLCALTFLDAFRAGASYYGISDLEAMARETHKFESRYLDRLIGPYPERADLYRARSPIHFTGQLSCPLILFQGLEDKVVPPNQAEMMLAAMRVKGLPVAYLAFEGEQHGFRRAETIARAIEAELYFYSRVFGFELADPVEPVEIENL
jgi:dipeptidyl aminopeptidase/acylaminoacyl peptidase